MRVLEETIAGFSATQYEQLTFFIEAKPSKRKRKDLLLLGLIRSQEAENASVLQEVLELDPKSNAFHALRKRLLKLVMHFIYLKDVEEDSSPYAEIQHLLSFARHCRAQGKLDLSQKFLSRASNMAEEHDFYCLHEKIHIVGTEKV